MANKNAFQYDAYRLLVDSIPACIAEGSVTARGCICPGEYLLGVYLPRGCTCPGGGVPAQGGVLAQGVSLPGGVPARGCTCQGVCLPGRYLPRYSSPVNRMTDRCKNITLPETSFEGGNYYFWVHNVHFKLL